VHDHLFGGSAMWWGVLMKVVPWWQSESATVCRVIFEGSVYSGVIGGSLRVPLCAG